MQCLIVILKEPVNSSVENECVFDTDKDIIKICDENDRWKIINKYINPEYKDCDLSIYGNLIKTTYFNDIVGYYIKENV